MDGTTRTARTPAFGRELPPRPDPALRVALPEAPRDAERPGGRGDWSGSPDASSRSPRAPRRRRSTVRASTRRPGFTTRHLALAFLTALALATAWTARTPPADVALLPCPFHSLTGIPCPGCGMTRACLALARGDLAGAWSLHPFAYLLVPLALLAALTPRPLHRAWTSLPPTARTSATSLALTASLAVWATRLV